MNYLNLNEEHITESATALNVLLVDYHMYYQKLRNFHWNVTGKNFFDLHNKFEELYDDAKLKIDEIAERILTLRFQPISNYSDFLKKSHLTESPSNLDDVTMVEHILQDHGTLLKQMRSVIEIADKANDEGTIDMIGGYIADIEKVSWMLDAWLMNTSENHPAT